MKRKFLISIMFLLSFCFMPKAQALYTDASVGSYEQELAKFPCDYQNKIRSLHNIYPNAVFVAQNIFFDWNKYKEVPVKWSDMLTAEKTPRRSLIEPSAPASYRTSVCGQGSGSNCSWYQASDSAIIYYLNPYNFLDETHVFMFESQFNNTYQTQAGVENILKNTFMDNKTCPGSNKTYAAVIMEAAQKYNISPYMLASRLKQENGRGTSKLVTGYDGYYNLFNINASGSTTEDIYKSGYQCANGTYVNSKGKKPCTGNNWTSHYLSIIGGSKFIREDYVGINDLYNVKGQMTGYLQKWDPYGPQYGLHQYMQNIRAPYYEAESTYNSYKNTNGYKNYRYIFHIPIYDGAPNTGGNCSTSGSQSNNNQSNNNSGRMPYATSGDYVTGIGQGTSASTVASNTGGTVTDYSGRGKSGKMATGDRIYAGGRTYTVVINGDVNGDGEIKATDYVKIKNHIMGSSKLSGAALKAADVNKDGNVKATDYVKIKNHIMGISRLS